MGKYHNGDLCKIWTVYDFKGFSSPNPPPFDEWQKGLIVKIVGNYSEICGETALCNNTADYRVEIPQEYNPQCYNEKGEFQFGGIWSSANPFSWAWVYEENLTPFDQTK